MYHKYFGKKLTDLLFEKGLITERQLQEAIVEQRKTGEKLVKLLVKAGLVSQIDIINLLEKELGISQANIPLTVAATVLSKLPEPMVRRHRVFPVRIENNALVVAMTDPLNPLIIDELQQQTKMEIRPEIATEEQIDAAIARHFEVAKLEQEMMVYERQTNTYGHPKAEDNSTLVRLVNSIIKQGIDGRASDIHIEPGPEYVLVRQRVDGMLREMMHLPLSSHSAIISRIKIMANMDIAEKRLPQDGRAGLEHGNSTVDLRVSVIPAVFGEKAVIRILKKDRQLMNISRLGFSKENFEIFKTLTLSTSGIILATGPTGSGKNTTLYAVLHGLNSPEKNIITIEDPVEYTIKGITQVQVNSKVGLTFALGLRSILRQDPDIIMVGEIRDKETAEIAVRAATTGHLVISTMHTKDAADAVYRLIDLGVSPFLVASSLLGVVAQRLVRKICPHCREASNSQQGEQVQLLLPELTRKSGNFFRGRGCSYCDHTGYYGRTGIHEILVPDRQIKELIVRGVSAGTLKKAAEQKGMVTLQKDAIHKVAEGLTTIEEVKRVLYTV
ncbi:GspE/PulE family protein [Desulfofalx alkaliphila]|uniref:GspE/PulE family protein n=1 Tax=Desulfofalx alkaliphila TaxID=105483 RepID=UPI0004E1D7EA|nr:GspE/PulE family protein [Desulfofalx alkaliphila]